MAWPEQRFISSYLVYRSTDSKESTLNSIYCFLRQTWPVKELVVLNTTTNPIVPDEAKSSVREVAAKLAPLGQLKISAVKLLKGEWVFQWLPSVWYDAKCLEFFAENIFDGVDIVYADNLNAYCCNVRCYSKGLLNDQGSDQKFIESIENKKCVMLPTGLINTGTETTVQRKATTSNLHRDCDNSVILQLGRLGDIINVLPICKSMCDRLGRKTKLMIHTSYANVIDRVSYVEPILFDGSIHDVRAAEAILNKQGKSYINCMFFGNTTNEKHGENFLKAQWDKLGYYDKWGNLPVVFDKRDLSAEKRIVDKLRAKTNPYVVVCWSSYSSPPSDAQRAWIDRLVGKECKRWGYDIVNISDVKADNFIDMLGLLEKAALLICADTSILHLNRATTTPSIHFGKTNFECSGNVENVIFHCPWSDMTAWESSITKSIHSILRPDMPVVPMQIKGKSRMSVICYLPPPDVGYNSVFLENMAQNPSTFKITYISETEEYGPQHLLATPIKVGKTSHETAIGIFNEVINVADSLNTEFFMVIEPDCRVKGNAWDERLLYEALTYNPDFVAAGTPVAFNIQFASPGIRAVCKILLRDYNRLTGSDIYPLKDEWMERNQWAFFPNGCFAIYRTKEAVKAWRANTYANKPWDVRIGMELFRLLGISYLEQFSLVSQALSFNGECFIKR
jgi:hypothetical protein